jgi:hypothetical protein
MLDCQDEVPTLCGIDLVDIEEAISDLQTKIKTEGILIYGSKEKRELSKRYFIPRKKFGFFQKILPRK